MFPYMDEEIGTWTTKYTYMQKSETKPFSLTL
jgi:hypothetical protein